MSKRNNIYLDNKNRKVPSVTTILSVINKPALNDWRARLGMQKAEEIVNAASELGSLIHLGIEAIVNDRQIPKYKDLKVEKILNNFKLWSDQNIEDWLIFEKGVYHDELGYAGTIDAIAKLKGGKICLCDFKTSKSIHASYYLQTVAYKNCTRIEDDIFDLSKIQGIIIIHLDHELLVFESVNVIDDGSLFEVFKAALILYNWQQANDR